MKLYLHRPTCGFLATFQPELTTTYDSIGQHSNWLKSRQNLLRRTLHLSHTPVIPPIRRSYQLEMEHVPDSSVSFFTLVHDRWILWILKTNCYLGICISTGVDLSVWLWDFQQRKGGDEPLIFCTRGKNRGDVSLTVAYISLLLSKLAFVTANTTSSDQPKG